MTDYSTKLLLDTDALSVRDIVCSGNCRHKSAEECSSATYLVFPYRGVYVRHLNGEQAVAEANQVLFFNQTESYRISHPVGGGDACLSLCVSEGLLDELTPKEQRVKAAALRFRTQRLRIDARTQMRVAALRHGLSHNSGETLEAEIRALTLSQCAVGVRDAPVAARSRAQRKLVDRAKLVLLSDLSRRWTLCDVAREVGASPVYLTQIFQQVEAMPLYRYQLRLRLTRALDLLPRCDDLTDLSLGLGFSSHSHFTSAFRQAYGSTPARFRQSLRRQNI